MSATKNYFTAVYVASLYRFGETLYCASESEDDAKNRIMFLYMEMFNRLNGEMPTKAEFQDAQECIEILKLPIGKAIVYGYE